MGHDLKFTRKTSNVKRVWTYTALKPNTPIATAKGKADVALYSSIMETDLGNHDVEMNLYLDEGTTYTGTLTMELIVPALDECTSCTIYVENHEVVDYSGWTHLSEANLELLALFGISEQKA